MKHGGDLSDAIAQYGGGPPAWLDLSTGINPCPWPVPAILAAEVWQRLPSRADHEALIAAARAAYHVPAHADIVAAPGTQGLIQWLPHLAPPGAVAVVGPTYSEHAIAWRAAGRDVIDVDSIEAAVARAPHVVVVNPNNPDGRIIDHPSVMQAARAVQRNGGWLVIDEAFVDTSPRSSAVALCGDDPIVILRSFGKFYGLAGIRLGFAIAAPSVTKTIAAALGPWSCSGPALAIGTAALRDHEWAEQTRGDLREMAQAMDRVLTRGGLELIDGTALFRLARHHDAAVVHARLARQHIWCRRFDHADDLLRFGLPPDMAALDRLAAALGSDA
ncbi:threonine-phosphate decarboxylase CobD [Bradyrhizobium prioriisuperbiae]|uniref:threonine-phosphate decarboxylase CobD n=1 Tax=Bradyrhizobium prioriisuperbiae TaxID=2854389 RepID=UPI0028E7384A|nr:threonine-phosphate decarboxylase CobD [Bradyrhizobium prioritasuperba]